MNTRVQDLARLPLSLLTRLRLVLLGHEDLAGIVFWAALVGFCGALASVGFREGIHLPITRPLSGALFVSEIVLVSTAMESFGPLVVASVTASATTHRFLGFGPVYVVPHVEFASNWELSFMSFSVCYWGISRHHFSDCTNMPRPAQIRRICSLFEGGQRETAHVAPLKFETVGLLDSIHGE